MRIVTKTPTQTRRVGNMLAQKILAQKPDTQAKAFGLIGELGSGKTTFLQGVAQGLGLKKKILSPTFLIMRSFRLTKPSPFRQLYHLDCYRLDDPKDSLSLIDFESIVRDPGNVIFVEWADKAKKYLPQNTIFITFRHKGKTLREIFIPIKNFRNLLVI